MERTMSVGGILESSCASRHFINSAGLAVEQAQSHQMPCYSYLGQQGKMGATSTFTSNGNSAIAYNIAGLDSSTNNTGSLNPVHFGTMQLQNFSRQGLNSYENAPPHGLEMQHPTNNSKSTLNAKSKKLSSKKSTSDISDNQTQIYDNDNIATSSTLIIDYYNNCKSKSFII
jgi:hypothetical protein